MNIFVIGGALFIIAALAWYVWYTRHEGQKKAE